MIMGYDSTLEWVVGRNIADMPKKKAKSNITSAPTSTPGPSSKPRPNTLEKRRSKAPRRRVLVHVETSDEGSIYSETSVDDPVILVKKKKVHFDEAAVKEAEAKAAKDKDAKKVDDCSDCKLCKDEREAAALKASEAAKAAAELAEKEAAALREEEAKALKEKEAKELKEREAQAAKEKQKSSECDCKACQEHKRVQDAKEKEAQAAKEKQKLKQPECNCKACLEHWRVQVSRPEIVVYLVANILQKEKSEPPCKKCKAREEADSAAKKKDGNEE